MSVLTRFLQSAAAAAVALAAVLPSAQAAGPVRVQLFSAFEEAVGSRIFFDQPAGEFFTSAIAFGPEPNWWPLGTANSFGALLTGRLWAAEAGDYTVTLGSDDASYLFVDGQLVLSLPGAHSYYTQPATLTLEAGLHTMELQFYNSFCCGSALTLDPGGLAYADAVPEPASLPLWLAGLGVTGWTLRRRLASAARA